LWPPPPMGPDYPILDEDGRRLDRSSIIDLA
jgi:hypothetical protein